MSLVWRGLAAFLKHTSGDAEEALCFRWQTQQVQLVTWVAGDWKRINLCLSSVHVAMGASTAGGVPQGRWRVPCCTAAGSRDSTLHSKWLLVQMLTQVYRKCCLRDCCYACAADPVCSHAWVTYWGEIKRAKTLHLSEVSLFLSFPGNKRHFPKYSSFQYLQKRWSWCLPLRYALNWPLLSKRSLINVTIYTKDECIVFNCLAP